MLGEFFLDGKTWPGFLFPVLVAIARGWGVEKNGALSVALVLRRTLNLVRAGEGFPFTDKFGRVFLPRS